MSEGRDGSPPDLYATLGIDRTATQQEIVRAWRLRARAEHPDSRPSDAAAPARFRALAQAYEVLADPARRAAYDRETGHPLRSGGRAAAAPRPGTQGAQLRAGPVYIEVPYGAAADPLAADEDAGLLDLALWYLMSGRRRPW